MFRDGRKAVAQPLERPPEQHRRSLKDWTVHSRSTALQALRYSRFVAVMKRALPLAAAVIVASVVAYSVMPRRADKMQLAWQQTGLLRHDLTMTKPRLSGTDEKGNPFVVTAASAVQDPVNRHRATLRDVDADMQFEGSKWLNATATLGLFDMDAGTLKLTGGIALYTDTGYELHTNSADVNIRKNTFEGNEKVTGQGPLGSLAADRFHFDRLKKQVKLDGHVRMVMYPKKAHRR
ncbi:MAG: LPS export ABC transporter periplasmic protein LptC [Alphaproteobacteria bacterium]|nr:LPS export ABC transporter periplasmic protein LptC [Alphaproteobacteria bacterium]